MKTDQIKKDFASVYVPSRPESSRRMKVSFTLERYGGDSAKGGKPVLLAAFAAGLLLLASAMALSHASVAVRTEIPRVIQSDFRVVQPDTPKSQATPGL